MVSPLNSSMRTSSVYSYISEVVFSCPTCGSKDLVVNDQGEVVCRHCGTVVVEHPLSYMYPMEYRGGDSGDGNGSRGGGYVASRFLYKATLGGARPREGKFSRYYGKTIDYLELARKVLGLPSHTINEAYTYVKKYVEKTYRKNIALLLPAIVGAAIYILTREAPEQPRTLKEIANAVNAPPRRILMIVEEMKRMGIAKPWNPREQLRALVARYGRMLNMPPEVITKAIKVAYTIREKTSSAPTAVAAAALYYVAIEAGISVTKKDIAKVTGRTPPTITHVLKRAGLYKGNGKQ